MPILVRFGGTSEIFSQIETTNDVNDIIVTCRGDPDDGKHSPDEHFSLENYRRDNIATVAIMHELGNDTDDQDATVELKL